LRWVAGSLRSRNSASNGIVETLRVGWEKRLLPVRGYDNVLALDPYDLALVKLVLGRPKDLELLRAMVGTPLPIAGRG
jgi:hypothetical protein